MGWSTPRWANSASRALSRSILESDRARDNAGAIEQSITALDWMSEETKAKALEKLAKFSPKIGYPDKWRDFSGLEVRRDDLVGNARRSAAFEMA